MDILFVSDVYLPTVSGVASSTDSITRFLANRGHRVTLVCPKPVVPFSPELPDGLTIAYTPPYSDPLFVGKSMTLFPLGIPALYRAYRSRRFDVVHIQEPGSLGISALILSKFFRVPSVGADHFSLLQVEKVAPSWIRWASVPFMKWYIRQVYGHYDAIMVPTDTAAKELSSLIGRKGRIHPVSNGVDTTVYVPRRGNPGPLRKKFKLAADPPVFLYIGRLDPDKNLDTMLRAVARLTIPATTVIAGVGKQKVWLHERASALGLSGRVVWMENLNARTILELYQLADVFVITSPVETQSIVTLQAIACGLPVLAAEEGALPELVTDGKNGYLIRTYDDAMLAEKMTYLAGKPALRSAMGTESRNISLSHHKPVVLEKLETLYRSVAHVTSG